MAVHLEDETAFAHLSPLDRQCKTNKASEVNQLKRDLQLLTKSQNRLHFCHLSSAASIQLIKKVSPQIRKQISGEITPHHLLFNEATIEKCGNFKMNPPIGTIKDQQALIAALNEGVIKIIATDHAPHLAAEKAAGFAQAPFGVIGLEQAFASLYTHLVLPGKVSLQTIINALTIHPAQAFNLPVPKIQMI